MAISPTQRQYIAAFDARQYLVDYGQPDDEGRFTIAFLCQVLRQLPSNMVVLEFGGGPTLHTVAALTPAAREIHICDLVPANLDEIRDWLYNEPNAFDWTPYLKLVLDVEGRPDTPADIAHRAADMRRKVTRLLRCDALALAPTPPLPLRMIW